MFSILGFLIVLAVGFGVWGGLVVFGYPTCLVVQLVKLGLVAAVGFVIARGVINRL